MEAQVQIDELKEALFLLVSEGARTERSINRLSREMKEFKDEMKEFKITSEKRSIEANTRDELFRAEMRDFKNEMKNEMTEFKGEMTDYKNQVDKDIKEMKKQWGNLANKMGTVVEDIIVPAVRPLVKEYFKEDVSDLMIRREKFVKTKNLRGEYDIIALTEQNIYLFEVKSTPSKEYLEDFIKNIEKFRLLFPEYSGKKLIPVFGGLWVKPEVIELCSNAGVFLMTYREWDYMDILNFDNVIKKEF